MKILLCILPPVAPDCPPLGAAALAGALHCAGHECSILDANIDRYQQFPDEQWRWTSAGWLSWSKPFWISQMGRSVTESVHGALESDVGIRGLALSVSSAARIISEAVIDEVRTRFPRLPIIVGGPGFFHSEDIFSFSRRNAVSMCQGEGDLALVQWAQQLETGILCDSMVLSARVRSLDLLPVPDFSGFDLKKYERPDVLPAETSRGCVNHCCFCDDTQMWRGYRMKSPHAVGNDLAALKQLAGHVSFSDSLLNPTAGRIAELAEVISTHRISWDGMLQCKGVDEDIAKRLRSSGCKHVFLGVESFNASFLLRLRKSSTPEDGEQAVRALHGAGIEVSMGLIVAGPPLQSRADFECDLRKLQELAQYLGSVAVNPLCVPQGTPLWNEGKDIGVRFPAISPWWFWHGPGGLEDVRTRFGWCVEAIELLRDCGLLSSEPAARNIANMGQMALEAEDALCLP